MVSKLPEKQSNTLSKQDSIQKVLIQTTGFGGAFGLLVTILTFSRYGFEEPVYLYLTGIPLFCALIAGFAGLSNVYLDRFLLNHGPANSKKKQLIGVGLTILISMFLGLSAAAYLGFFNLKEQLPFIVTTTIIGLVLGMIVAIIDDHIWNIRRKLLTLEMENKYLAELAEKDRQIQETTKNLIVAEERNRMARELHDSISQGIHGIIYTAHSLKEQLPEEDNKTGKILEHLLTTAEITLNELQAMILELKPSLLEKRGLTEALKYHCELFTQRLKIKCILSIGDICEITSRQEMAVYRIVQEALSNIQQHAGANEVTINLFQEGDYLKLIITDNGRGFEMKGINHGNGMYNMESRCLENVGNLRVESIPGRGTKIKAIFQIK